MQAVVSDSYSIIYRAIKSLLVDLMIFYIGEPFKRTVTSNLVECAVDDLTYLVALRVRSPERRNWPTPFPNPSRL